MQLHFFLESLQSQESLWTTRNISYRNPDAKKREYVELIDILKEDMPGVDLKAVKGNTIDGFLLKWYCDENLSSKSLYFYHSIASTLLH